MRVTGAATARAANAGVGARAALGSGFILQAAPMAAAPVASTRATPGLLALQDLPLSPEERRRKAVRRASVMLDGLAELQRDLLAGDASVRTLDRLRARLAEGHDIDADEALTTLLCAVETRCAVELAKLERDKRSG